MLKELRAKKGLTVRQLEALTGVKNTNISAMENHKVNMGDNAAAKLAPVLGVKADELQAAETEARVVHLGERLTALDPETLADVTGAKPDKAKAAIAALLDLAKDEGLPGEVKKVVEQTLLKLLKSTKQAAEKSTRQPDRDLHGRKRPAAQESKRDPAGRSREPEPVKRDPQGRRQK